MPQKLAYCKFCGKEVAPTAKSCPHCGESNPVPIHKGLLGCVGVIIIAVILIVGIGITSKEKPVSPEKPVVSSEEIATLTPEQRVEFEKAWGGALSSHCEQLEAAFNQFKPDNYQGFAQYKVKDWLPKLAHNRSIMNYNWEKFGLSRLKPEFETLRDIYVALVDLNSVSIDMQSYLKNHKKVDLEFINKKLFEISKVSLQYVEYQPKPDK